MPKLPRPTPLLTLLLGLLPLHAGAQSAAGLLDRYSEEARREAPAYAASAARGEALFHLRGKDDWRCAGCHTDKPVAAGRHLVTGKPIAPLAPAANPERFTDAARAEKWFRRNCTDVLERPCSAAEKGDLLAYLLEQRP